MNQSKSTDIKPGCDSPGCFDHPATPAPLDPSKVKTGDTVTLTRKMSTAVGPVTRIDRSDSKGTGFHIDGYPYPLWTHVHPRWTLADHQPAPEPEPEPEPKWKPGTKGTGTINGLKVGGFISEFRGEIGFYYWNEFAGRTSYSGGVPEDFASDIVIDPAAVDVDAIEKTYARAYVNEHLGTTARRAGILAVLAELGIEAP